MPGASGLAGIDDQRLPGTEISVPFVEGYNKKSLMRDRAGAASGLRLRVFFLFYGPDC
jgi:hypothetical protein